MAKLLFRLGRWSYNFKWRVIITWLILLVGVAAAALSLQKPFTSQFAISGTPAINATAMLVENFPDQPNPVKAAGVNLVFKAPDGETLEDPDNYEAVNDVIKHLEDNLAMTGTERFGNPVDVSPKQTETIIQMETEMGLPQETAEADAANVALLTDDKRIGYTTFNFDSPSSFEVKQSDRDIVTEAMEIGREAGLQVEAGGAGFGDPIQVKTTSEIIGLVVAFFVLIFTFGSLVAAGMPVISAVIGVGIGALLIVLATHWVELTDVTPVLAVMIGLAVGIDYALFILSRYRQERQRMSGPEAAGMAVGTAGSSVVFAGFTVFTALAALTIARIEFLTWMGLAAAVTVLIAVLVALTLIPAMLGVVGDRAFAGKVPGVAGNPARGKRLGKDLTKNSMGRRWVNFVRRVPALVMAVVVLFLGILSAPVLGMELALPSDSTSNKDTTQRKSADLIAEGFGEGVNSPFLVVVDAHSVNPEATVLQPYMAAQEGTDPVTAASQSSFLYAVNELNQVSGVKHAQLVSANDDNTAAQILITPTTGPDDQYTVAVAEALRAQGEQIQDSTGSEIGLTGLTAVQMDITEALEGAMPLYLAVVVGLAIVLLLLVFRSIMVPVVAGLGFLLSVGASFGVTVLVWQEGLFGLVNTPGPLLSFLPIFLIGVTFGLAMDYQVFLVTRMKEQYTALGGEEYSGGVHKAVERSTVEGFVQGARVVTAAAVIMIVVFVAFIDQPLPFIQIFGFALGISVFFDAFFIRMALVPATMFIMGRATWWMPKWLDKILPDLDVEGSALEKEYDAKLEAQAAHTESMQKVSS
ncbi:MMPL family transporter [Corynebacterium breve]|uniref:MMPL family transporter n=1 Tax=Corynebacterium breve TaxID=3049799 RepID=A0ABY8VJZ4_9CORY|nr:MMPL family transporter [Corynebacterium breve]WIM67895.1 MMPL family transporter [Corynebacterium breve]